MKEKYPKLKLEYHWLWYVGVLCVAILWWVLAFQMYHVPPAEDKVIIFYAGTVTDASLGSQLEDAYGIRLVEVYSSRPDSTEFAEKYNVVGMNSSYILLIPKSVADQTLCEDCFIPLEELGLSCESPYLQQKLPQSEEEAQQPMPMIAYGIPVGREILSRHFRILKDDTGAELDYYLFVGGKALDEDGKLYPHTLEVIEYFLGN